MLPTDKVRYIGENVAAVAAVGEETALEALSRIRVDYEPLPGVFGPLEAMQEGAPLIHDQYETSGTQVGLRFSQVPGSQASVFSQRSSRE